MFSVLDKFFIVHVLDWVVPEKIHTPPKEEISAVQRGRGEKNCF
jgi:hypothetical protein